MKQYLIAAAVGIFLAIAGWFWHEHDVEKRSTEAVRIAKQGWGNDAKTTLLAANKATRDRETATFRQREIDEANRSAEKDRLAAAESALARDGRGLRDAISQAISRERPAENATDPGRPSQNCAEPLRLFGEAASEAEGLAVEAGRLAHQVSGLQQYAKACYQLTNPRPTPPGRHEVDNDEKEGHSSQ